MEPIRLLEPIGDSDTENYLRFSTIADIERFNRNQQEPLGFEVDVGSQQFIIPKRSEITTNWFVEWEKQYYKIIGIFPAKEITRMILYCRLVEFRGNVVIALKSFEYDNKSPAWPTDDDSELQGIVYG